MENNEKTYDVVKSEKVASARTLLAATWCVWIWVWGGSCQFFQQKYQEKVQMKMTGHKWRDLTSKMDELEMDMRWLGDAKLQSLLAKASENL